MHLAFNLLTLYFFGGRLEHRWGSERFIRFLIFVTMGAACIHLLITAAFWASGTSIVMATAPIWGTTALAFAVTMVYAMYYPDSLIYLFAIFPIKARYLVIIMGVLQLLFLGRTPFALTNLSGLLLGYLFARYLDLFDRISLPKLSRRRKPQSYERGRWRDL